jgi:methylase of polypeptide subunit release factors
LKTRLDGAQAAALGLLLVLEREGYRFTPVTPETHRRVTARPAMANARDLRGVFGWSLPFARDLLPASMFALMEAASFVQACADGWRSRVRVSEVSGLLFLHSAFPTDADDSIFLGPDSVRFARFILSALETREPPVRLVDIGAGAGVGGIVAGRASPDTAIELADINPAALRLAEVNAAFAGVPVRTCVCDGIAGVARGFDLAIANPPFIFGEGGPAYRDGGAMLGAELSLRWAVETLPALAPGGALLLYTGSAIVDGRDCLKEALEEKLAPLGATLLYSEIDPDIFGEELANPGYDRAERIAAVGAVIERRKS